MIHFSSSLLVYPKSIAHIHLGVFINLCITSCANNCHIAIQTCDTAVFNSKDI